MSVFIGKGEDYQGSTYCAVNVELALSIYLPIGPKIYASRQHNLAPVLKIVTESMFWLLTMKQKFHMEASGIKAKLKIQNIAQSFPQTYLSRKEASLLNHILLQSYLKAIVCMVVWWMQERTGQRT